MKKKSPKISKFDADPFPQIKVISFKEKTGLAVFECNDAFVTLYKETEGKKRVTERGLGNFVLKLILEEISARESKKTHK